MGDLVQRYLDQLGLPRQRPTARYLARVHAAHVDRFAHDTVWMVRGRVPRLVEPELVEALLDGEGGGCLQLNVGLCWLLRELGLDPVLHRATAQSTFQLEASRHHGEHCVVTATVDGVRWLLDVGTGTGHLEPLPLLPGTYLQGGFRYEVRHRGEGVWRIEHDRRPRALRAVELTLAPAAPASFEQLYDRVCRDPDSPYRRTAWAQRRTSGAVEMLHLRTLRIRTPQGWQVRHLTTAEEWVEQLRGRFGLGLPGLAEDEQHRLWELTADPSPDVGVDPEVSVEPEVSVGPAGADVVGARGSGGAIRP
ncbi:arylamine N-acetyltransferase [Arsenicicoccus cauae]|uniref:Arylamine N-acetyltransferase n=1 Tax=Arsenicicoccus cauae TaxID=2663847 RepID=A0A6I3IK81_9MICO|nr:arylamine N-acetyltransferase [Arsenicicoccus cauae]MTB72075.1 hypothetical protein [Arsenicicoccus cauae]